MPTMANIVLNDTTSPTPVAHTFKPMSLVDNIGTYSDSSSGTVQSWPKITISVRPASVTNGGHKVVMKITIPVARANEEGSCCVPRGTPLPANIVTVEFLRSNDSLQKDTLDALAYLAQAVEDSQFTDAAKGESLR